MFDPIQTPVDDYHGPSVGLSREHGDSFKSAMEKINAGFNNVISHIRGGAGSIEDWIAKNFVSFTTHDALAERVKALEDRLEALMTPGVLAIGGQGDPNAPPVPAPNAETFTAPGAGAA